MSMNIQQRLRACAKHTGLDAVIELLQEAADEIDRLSGGQQSEVTDEQILSLDCVSIDSDEHGTSFWVDRSTVIKFARAILALRPAAVPMNQDEVIAAIKSANISSSTTFLSIFEAGIRAAEAHQGITAQAKKEDK